MARTTGPVAGAAVQPLRGNAVSTVTKSLGNLTDQSISDNTPLPGPLLELHLLGQRTSWYACVKMALDWLLALFILLVSAPFMLLAMLLVKLTSPGPALYSQVRVGRDGHPFTLYKIRSMRHECENLTGAQWSTPGDSRITPIGRLLRKTHLDELPQLWNVLRGDMSLVGPRPERPEFVPQLERAIPHYHKRLLVRPGLTGLAQVQLPPDTNLESVRLKLAYDIHYVQHVGLGLDLRLLAATAFKVVGLPFAAIRRVCSLPQREVVQTAYHNLNGSLLAVPARAAQSA
jgi:lipopolysaccharide/colanic/teichoic acid biosynthesis glycosyltransferase